MAKEKEDKIVLEREYIVPLRKKVNISSRYRRARKAINVLKQFVKRHMKAYDTGIIKIDRLVNEEMWSRGMEKPPAKIKVRCKKFESGIIKVELAEIPQFIKWRIEKEKKLREAPVKKAGKEEKKEELPAKTEEEKKEEQTEEKKIEEKEKEKSEVESSVKMAEEKHKEIRHEPKMTKMPKHARRMALQK